MSFDRYFIGKLHQLGRQNLQELGSGFGRLGIARFKEKPALGLDQIDPQTLGGQRDFDLLLHVLERRNLLQDLFQFFLEMLQLVAIQRERFPSRPSSSCRFAGPFPWDPGNIRPLPFALFRWRSTATEQ